MYAFTCPYGCVRDALTLFPAAPQALSDAVNPPCTRLGTQACAARYGCFLKAHDDHFDCVRTPRYATDFLLALPAGPAEHSACW